MVDHPLYDIEFKPALAYFDYDQTYDLLFFQYFPRHLETLLSYLRIPVFGTILIDRFSANKGAWADDYSTKLYELLKQFNYCPYNSISDLSEGGFFNWRANEFQPADNEEPPIDFINPFVPSEFWRPDLDYVAKLPKGKTRISYLYDVGSKGISFQGIGQSFRTLNKAFREFKFDEETDFNLNEFFFTGYDPDLDRGYFVANSLIFETQNEDGDFIVFRPDGITDKFWLYEDIDDHFNELANSIISYFSYLENWLQVTTPVYFHSGRYNCPYQHYIERKELDHDIDDDGGYYSGNIVNQTAFRVITKKFPQHYLDACGLIYANHNRWGGEIKADLGMTPAFNELGVKLRVENMPDEYRKASGRSQEGFRSCTGNQCLDNYYSGFYNASPLRSYDHGYRIRDYENYADFAGRVKDYLIEEAWDALKDDVNDSFFSELSPYFIIWLGSAFDYLRLNISPYEDSRFFPDVEFNGLSSINAEMFVNLSEVHWKTIEQRSYQRVEVEEAGGGADYIKIAWMEFITYFDLWFEVPQSTFTEYFLVQLFVDHPEKPFSNHFSPYQDNVTTYAHRTPYTLEEFNFAFYQGDLSPNKILNFFVPFIANLENFMVDSLRTKEIHATLNAGYWAYNEEGNDDTGLSIADKLDLLCKALGIAFDRDGNIISLRQRKNIEYDGLDVTIPDGWARGQFALNTGGSTVGQEGGTEDEQRLGMAYQNRSNRWTNDAVCADGSVEVTDPNNAIERGDVVLCENIPQFIEALIDDLDKALNWQEMGAAVVPNADNTGKYCRFEGMGTLLADTAWTLSHLSKNIIQSHLMNLKQEAMIMELYRGLGLPVTAGSIPVKVGIKGTEDNRKAGVVFPTFSRDVPTIMQLLYSVLSNLAPILANCTELEETPEE